MRFAKITILIAIAAAASLLLLGSNKNFHQPVQHKEAVRLPGIQATGLPYSPAIKVGNMMFLSGVIGTDLKTGELVSPDVAGQTRQCMEKLKAVLHQGGMDFSDVVRATVYLADINDYNNMNKAYASYFLKDPPARACVQVAKLVREAKVEISMIAIKVK